MKSYFTILNCWAIKGDDSPKINHDSQGSGEQSSVVIKKKTDNGYSEWIILTQKKLGDE